MSQSSLFELLTFADHSSGKALLVLDENIPQPLPAPVNDMQVISNRFDIHTQAVQAQWPSTFSDFDFANIDAGSLACGIYRISKEKRVVEHVLQELWARLQIGGQLCLAGFKNEGIKTYAKRVSSSFGCNAELSRGNQHLHLYRFIKTRDTQERLNREPYSPLVQIGHWEGLALWSKPGIFAWDRIDDGSALLLEQLPELLSKSAVPRRGLDLGCGFGLLALALLKAGCSELLATDNNAAALLATAHNLHCTSPADQAEVDFKVVPADAGEGLKFSADLLLCNPPFHQGFAVENSLTSRFLQAAHRLLAPKGQALFVVNSFIPLEKLAAQQFGQVTTLVDNHRFKVIRLSRQAAQESTG